MKLQFRISKEKAFILNTELYEPVCPLIYLLTSVSWTVTEKL